jgi:hypothetical protein
MKPFPPLRFLVPYFIQFVRPSAWSWRECFLFLVVLCVHFSLAFVCRPLFIYTHNINNNRVPGGVWVPQTTFALAQNPDLNSNKMRVEITFSSMTAATTGGLCTATIHVVIPFLTFSSLDFPVTSIWSVDFFIDDVKFSIPAGTRQAFRFALFAFRWVPP